MENLLSLPKTEYEPLKLGIILTLIQVVVYFAFILSCSYAQAFMASPFLDVGIPRSFAFGLAVIALGVVLTVIYVVVTNRREAT